jgi:hypothetical protein
MAKKIPIDQLQSELHKILEEYGEDVANGTREAVTKVAQKCAKAVRGNSAGSFGGSGKYAKGWTYQSEYRRLGSVATIYNRTPGLPHLLENGHAKRGGGRVPGRTHIAPVETEIITEIERAIQEVATR